MEFFYVKFKHESAAIKNDEVTYIYIYMYLQHDRLEMSQLISMLLKCLTQCNQILFEWMRNRCSKSFY